jgi:multiple antibiotic resistance protein
MVQGNHEPAPAGEPSDLSIVPLAIPVIIGPSVTGTLLVMGADFQKALSSLTVCLGLVCAILTLMFCLFLSRTLEKLFGDQGLNVLVKLSGLMITSLAAQMIFTGIRSFIR